MNVSCHINESCHTYGEIALFQRRYVALLAEIYGFFDGGMWLFWRRNMALLYIYIYIYIYTYIHMYMYTYMFHMILLYTCIYIYIYMNVTCIHRRFLNTCVNIFALVLYILYSGDVT